MKLMKIVTRCCAVLCVSSVAFVACGGSGGGSDDVSDSTTPPNNDGATTVPDSTSLTDQTQPSGPLTATIVADVTEGNAPLTVSFDVDVTGVLPENVNVKWDFGGGTTSNQKETVFTFYKTGDFNVSVQVFEKGNPTNIAEDDVIIRVREPADLSISNVSIVSVTEVMPGDSIAVRCEVGNEGGDVASTQVAIYLSSDEVFSPELDLELGRIDIEALTGGDAKVIDNAQVQIPENAEEGAYFIWAVIDPDQEAGDPDVSNNAALATDFITVSKTANQVPDLSVTDLDFAEGLNLAVGATLSYSLNISNLGEGDASSFNFAVFASTDTTLDDDDFPITVDSDSKIFSHKSGITLPIYRGYVVEETLPEGNYYLIAVVDSNEAVPESDESNNQVVSTATFQVEYVEVQGKDIELVELSVPTTGTYWGGAVKIDMVYRNNGTVPISGAKAAAYLTENKSISANVDFLLGTYFTLPTLPPGELVEVTHVAPVTNEVPLFDFYLGVVADPQNTIAELSESNNSEVSDHMITVESSATVSIKAISADFHPSTIDAGQEITLTYTVQNTGSSNSGGFGVWVVLSTDSTVTLAQAKQGTDLVVKQSGVADLSGGEVLEVVEKVLIPVALPNDQTAPYTVGVIINPNNSAGADQNSSDNIAVAPDLLTVLGAQGGCFEDLLEPNNNKDNATVADIGVISGTMCDVADWYAFEVEQGQTLNAQLFSTPLLSLEPIPSDLDLKIIYYSQSGVPSTLAEGDLNGDAESATAFIVPETGTYYVKVYPSVSGAQAQYELATQILHAQEGVDLFVNKVSVLPNETFPGGLVSVDIDLFNLGTDDAPEFEIEVFLSDDTDLDAEDVSVGTSTVSTVFASSHFNLTQDILLPVVPGGDYHLIAVVDSGEAITEGNETNNTGFSGSIFLNDDLACADDGFEPNNAPGIATVLPPEAGVLSEMVVCPGLEDWYSIDLEVGTAFSALATYQPDVSKGSIQVQLFASDGQTVITASGPSLTTSGNASLSIPYVFVGGTYYLRVYHVAGPPSGDAGPFTYNLGVSFVEPLESDICEPDVYEPNWSGGQATQLGCGQQKLTLCTSDIDVYTVVVPDDKLVTLTLNQENAGLRMRTYQDLSGPIHSQVNGNGSLVLDVNAEQVFYIVVQKKTASQTITNFNYTLQVDGIDGLDLSVGDVSPFPASILQGEDSYLQFTIENQCIDSAAEVDYGIYLSQDTALDEGDELLIVAALDGGILGNQVVEISKKVSLPQDAQVGPANLLVVADPYDLLVESNEWNNMNQTAIEIIEVCLEDVLEPNNAPTQAVFLSSGDYPELALCPNDYDWYTFDVTAGKIVNVSVDFVHDDGDLDLRLYHESSFNQPVASSLSKTDNESIEHITLQSGVYFIRVNGFAGAGNQYELSVDYGASGLGN